MKRYGSTCALAVVTVLLWGAPLRAEPPLSLPPAKEVIVVNPETEPVPVTGQVEIVAPPPATHMGQAPEDHVVLIPAAGGSFTCPTGSVSMTRMGSDGQTTLGEFVVPAGRSLVLTDIGIPVSEAPGVPWSAGSIVTLHVNVGVPGSASLRSLWQTSVQLDALLATARQTFIETALTSGVVIGSGQRVCLTAGFGFSPVTSSTISIPLLGKVYGYLVDGES